METNGLDINKLRSFGSDGCAIMVGRMSGAESRLKVCQLRHVSVHCINHRLALAAAHAADNIPYFKRFKESVQSLFLFYHNSAVRMAGFHAIQEIPNNPIIKLKQAKDLRWLSYDAAIGSILRTFPSIIFSLEREGTERSEPTAAGLAKFVKTYYFVACCHFLQPYISHLSITKAIN